MSSAIAFLTAFAGIAAAAAPPASYSVAFTDGLGPRLNPGALNMPVPSYSVNRWAWGTVPQPCYDQAVTSGYCNVYDIEVYDVTYSDVSLAFLNIRPHADDIVCFTVDAMSLQQLAFGCYCLLQQRWVRTTFKPLLLYLLTLSAVFP